MKLSFIIAAYNEELLLPRCLASVEQELKRTPVDAEVIVVNNASTDGTKEAALRFSGVRVVDEPHKGLTRARQAGYEASSGELLALLDADIILTEGWLAKALGAFEREPGLAAIGGQQIYYDAPRYIRFLWGICIYIQYFFYLLTRSFGNGSVLTGGNVMARRSALDLIGGFDTSIAFYGEDADLARRLSKAGRVIFTLSLPVLGSGRRLVAEGIFRMMVRYGINTISGSLWGIPVSTAYKDIRS